MKKYYFFLWIILLVLAASCKMAEEDQSTTSNLAIDSKLDSIQDITSQYDADSVYQKLEYVSKNYPLEFLGIDLSLLDAALEESRKVQDWREENDVQKYQREFEEITRGIQEAETEEEFHRLNEKFDSLYKIYEPIQRKHPLAPKTENQRDYRN